jgi:PAS domain-containing protein
MKRPAVPLGVRLVDRDFRIVHMNDLLAGLSGLSAEHTHRRSLAETMGVLWARVEPFYRQVLEGGSAITNVEVARSTEANRSRRATRI